MKRKNKTYLVKLIVICFGISTDKLMLITLDFLYFSVTTQRQFTNEIKHLQHYYIIIHTFNSQITITEKC